MRSVYGRIKAAATHLYTIAQEAPSLCLLLSCRLSPTCMRAMSDGREDGRWVHTRARSCGGWVCEHARAAHRMRYGGRRACGQEAAGRCAGETSVVGSASQRWPENGAMGVGVGDAVSWSNLHNRVFCGASAIPACCSSMQHSRRDTISQDEINSSTYQLNYSKCKLVFSILFESAK